MKKKIAVVGIGYVGINLACAFSKKFEVFFRPASFYYTFFPFFSTFFVDIAQYFFGFLFCTYSVDYT